MVLKLVYDHHPIECEYLATTRDFAAAQVGMTEYRYCRRGQHCCRCVLSGALCSTTYFVQVDVCLGNIVLVCVILSSITYIRSIIYTSAVSVYLYTFRDEFDCSLLLGIRAARFYDHCTVCGRCVITGMFAAA